MVSTEEHQHQTSLSSLLLGASSHFSSGNVDSTVGRVGRGGSAFVWICFGLAMVDLVAEFFVLAFLFLLLLEVVDCWYEWCLSSQTVTACSIEEKSTDLEDTGPVEVLIRRHLVLIVLLRWILLLSVAVRRRLWIHYLVLHYHLLLSWLHARIGRDETEVCTQIIQFLALIW